MTQIIPIQFTVPKFSPSARARRGRRNARPGYAAPSQSPPPDVGGNTPFNAPVTIVGEGIQQGATVILRRAGQSDIIGGGIFISADGSSLTARFNLLGQLLGAWDLVVTNPDATTFTITGGYTIEAGREPQVWIDILGRNVMRPNQATRLTVVCGNLGNTDAYGVPVFITGIPTDAVVELGFELMRIPRTPEMYIDPNDIPPVTQTATDQTIALIVPVIPAGGTKALQFTIKVPGTHTSVAIKVLANAPLLEVIPPAINSNGAAGPLQLTFTDAEPNCIKAILQNTPKLSLELHPRVGVFQGLG